MSRDYFLLVSLRLKPPSQTLNVIEAVAALRGVRGLLSACITTPQILTVIEAVAARRAGTTFCSSAEAV